MLAGSTNGQGTVMRHLPTAIALGLIAVWTAGCSKSQEQPKAAAAGQQTEEDKALYALGALVAGNLASFDLTEAELKHVQAGFADAALKKKMDIDPQSYVPKLQDLNKERVAKAGEVAKKAGEEYLKKAASEPGAKQTPTGLVYTEVTAGTGPTPAATDTVKVHYHGTLTDGTVFDSSVQRNEPATFPLSGVIPCWTEGVQMMKVGGKAKLTCPAAIAYGENGQGPIKPNSTLIFDVELLGIEK
jgi:FKBP-type peptidyl-prolyl cis-trans isomerase FkpA/FKBP-type peptidyl-prolyl cis-trans isomerase FklB